MVLRPAERLDALPGRGAGRVDVLRDRRRADEADRGDVRVLEDRVDRHLVAVHDVEDAVGEAGLLEQLRDVDRRGRVLLGRLQDERVPTRDRRRPHPHGHHRREVERRDPGRRLRAAGGSSRRRSRVEACSEKCPRSSVGIPQACSITSSPRCTSPFASDSTLPCSSVRIRAMSSSRSWTSSRIRNMSSCARESETLAPGRERLLRGRDGPPDLLDARRSRPRPSGHRAPGCRRARCGPTRRRPLAADPVADPAHFASLACPEPVRPLSRGQPSAARVAAWRSGAAAICALLLLVAAGCGSGGGDKSSSSGDSGVAPSSETSRRPETKAPWPAPENPMELTCKAGLVPEKAEFLQYHVHAHLDVFVNGKPVLVPAGIGIDIDNPAVSATRRERTVIGAGLTQECDQPCISPLHTHDLSGLLHTETKTPSPNQPRPVLHRVGRPPDAGLHRRLLQAGHPDQDLRRRQGRDRRPERDRAQQPARDRDRHRHATCDDPDGVPAADGRRRHQPRQERTTRSTSSTRGRCARRSTRSRSRAPRAATSGTSTASATSTSRRSSSTSRSGTSTRR